jgi:hypothetical protein
MELIVTLHLTLLGACISYGETRNTDGMLAGKPLLVTEQYYS